MGERIHVLGIGGAGASAAALLAKHAGAVVDGCDPGAPTPYTPALEMAGIGVASAHDASHAAALPAGSRLAVTKALTAVDPRHPELAAARANEIVIEPWQQVVADAAFGRRLIGVAGTHGKSTTAGWLVHVLTSAGRDPSAFVGALMPARLAGGTPATARWGSGPDFVVEADEYAGNFDPYRPSLAIVANLEWDHPDVFADGAAVVAALDGWLRAAGSPTVVANLADAGVRQLVDRLGDWPGRILGVALVDAGDPGGVRGGGESDRGRHAPELVGRIAAADPAGTTLFVEGLDTTPVEIRLPTAGRHNAANALCVAGVAVALGVRASAIAAGLATFAGIGRRLQRLGQARGVVVYDDYGHHPTAIRETLAAIRQREPGRRVWAVYEPLTYHRTAALLEQFAEELARADAVAIADIWAGRDPDTTIASAEGLAAAVRARRSGLVAEASGSVEATAGWLADRVVSGDAVLVMGGGRSYRIGELLIEALSG